jgi:hypothetical protein
VFWSADDWKPLFGSGAVAVAGPGERTGAATTGADWRGAEAGCAGGGACLATLVTFLCLPTSMVGNWVWATA